MTEQKGKTIVSIVTACVVVVFIAIIIGLVIQYINIKNLQAQERALDDKIQFLQEHNNRTQEEIEFLSNAENIEDMLRSLGYGKSDDILFK